MKKIAVVIPAYRSTYLHKALYSLALQTNKNFIVYVGDDCSPENIKSVTDTFSEEMEIVFHRFEDNLGGKDLVGQWERCVGLVQDEEWLWIFSDDDEAEPQCVEFFYKALETTKEYYDVYRFNTIVIDAQSEVLAETPLSPLQQNVLELAENILLLKTGNSMPDHIFNFSRYKELGGFIHTRFAQAADWASSINFAYTKGLYTIAGPRVRWRLSGQNLSSLAGARKSEMIFGHIEFLQWVSRKFNESDFVQFNIAFQKIHEAIRYNFINICMTHYKGIPKAKIRKVVYELSLIKGFSLAESIKMCYVVFYNMNLYPLKVKAHTWFISKVSGYRKR